MVNVLAREEKKVLVHDRPPLWVQEEPPNAPVAIPDWETGHFCDGIIELPLPRRHLCCSAVSSPSRNLSRRQRARVALEFSRVATESSIQPARHWQRRRRDVEAMPGDPKNVGECAVERARAQPTHMARH
ncbi:hypothetical protein AAL_08410 [Moelleriella libera RCEF 2490]|uniref:Uncharacterized protein n=1 Tax=Moelleriella libera RCEF 2490 TaxID=1081109 RepID=A0A167VBJ5_9HYPO|nr:hypothetical protein AAL_08410 [Moelleriella libera RCEF 2490]